MPEDAAARHTPFLDVMTGSMSAGRRFDSTLYLGAELGGFLDGRWRGALRAALPFGVSQPRGKRLSNPEFLGMTSPAPALLWGASLGVAAYSGRGFTLSITSHFMRTDVSAYGNLLGAAGSFEWVSRRGVRVGFETGLLAGLGGEVRGKCGSGPFSFAGSSSQSTLDCDAGEVRAFNRESAGGIWAHFFLGVPYDSPKPVPAPGN